MTDDRHALRQGAPGRSRAGAAPGAALLRDPLEKHFGLTALQDRSEPLFYRVLEDHLEELLPIVYAPTAGQACREHSRIFRRPRGLWITPDHRGRVAEVLANAPTPDIRLVVATDNERVPGLGDQGAGGMAMAIGKVALYTAAAGIHPTGTLPISLDVGTDDASLLDDELYVGWREPRLRGEPYFTLVDELVSAIRQRFPRAVLQWEGLGRENAFAVLERHRNTIPSFNDRIQGTGAVGLAAILAATRVTHVPLRDQRVVIVGAGARGVGTARAIRDGLTKAGLDGDRLRRAIALVDRQGLLVEGTAVEEFQRPFAWSIPLAESSGLGRGPRDLGAVVRALRPTVIIGACGQPGVLREGFVRLMATHVPRPVVLVLSGPGGRPEARPEDVLAWTQGRALVATANPFAPGVYSGHPSNVAQANNAFVFPGIGLGALVAEARAVTDSMFTAAAESLAAALSDSDLETGALLPPLLGLRTIAARVAEAVVREARGAGLGRWIEDEDIPAAVQGAMWRPDHLPPDGVSADAGGPGRFGR